MNVERTRKFVKLAQLAPLSSYSGLKREWINSKPILLFNDPPSEFPDEVCSEMSIMGICDSALLWNHIRSPYK